MAGRDPRYYQIAALGTLLAYGQWKLGFGLDFEFILLVLGTALLTQYVCSLAYDLPSFDPKSPLISGLSLCLLLRASHPGWIVFATLVAILSKFALRVDKKHVFNPTNFGLVAGLLVTDAIWVSPGQWGTAAFFGFFAICVGGWVTYRSSRSDVTLAFLVFYALLLFGRSAYLGEPWTIPWHRLQNGALLLFAFFMISDPRTTPDARWGRIAFAGLVATVAMWVQFGLNHTNALLWSLVAVSFLVPWINRIKPGVQFDWNAAANPQHTRNRSSKMKKMLATTGLALCMTLPAWQSVEAFCGFYVAKADASLFNEASRVVMVRNGDRTVITMVNDYKGDPKEFAMVVPVPQVLERGQIHVTDMALIDHLDAYTAPRLVEYFDPDPCRVAELSLGTRRKSVAAPQAPRLAQELDTSVTVEATYTVGEYDIVILSAKESDGLERWLRQNDYRIPDGASKVLQSYIKQDMKFFVAKVNLQEQSALGFSMLRPLQVAFESPKFMLPIRLGTVNARGKQDLLIYALTRTGQVETTNYRTVKLPTGMDLPIFVKSEFSDFYRDMFRTQFQRNNERAVFMEYAWDMGWCDPCAANPLTTAQLRELGVFWLPKEGSARRGRIRRGQDVYVTRLHVRYDAATFPEDLAFQETGDRSNFQGRYVLRHAWKGDSSCSHARQYFERVQERQEKEAETLASLTGWNLSEIHERMALDTPVRGSWWQGLWNN